MSIPTSSHDGPALSKRNSSRVFSVFKAVIGGSWKFHEFFLIGGRDQGFAAKLCEPVGAGLVPARRSGTHEGRPFDSVARLARRGNGGGSRTATSLAANVSRPAPKFRLIFSLQTADKLLGEVCAAGILRGPPLLWGIGRIAGKREDLFCMRCPSQLISLQP